jgi:UDPglucose 6-dehydrogenase
MSVLFSSDCFSEFGWTTRVDKDKRRFDDMRRGISQIHRPGLGHLMARNMKAGRLHFAEDLALAVR